MREIKFRGISEDNSEWVYGYYLSDIATTIIPYAIYAKQKFHKVVPESIGQFTGLHDKNGKEIYEGDILKCDGLRIVIQYSGCAFEGRYLGPQKDLWSPIRNNNYLQWVVIGNLHQNPELLNQ